MAVRGIFYSNSSIIGDRQPTLSGRVLMNEIAGSAPLLALSSGMPESKISDTGWSWIEDQHIAGSTTLLDAGGVNSSATTLNVADSNLWVAGSIILAEATGEHLYVSAVSGNAVTVVRGIGGSTAQAIAQDARLQLLGNAWAEGSGKPSPVSQQGESYSNLVQIFKNGWAITGTAKQIQFLTGSKLAQNKAQCAQYHAEDIERTFWFGRKGQQVIGGNEIRLTNGIDNQLNSYGGQVVSANYGGAGQMSVAGLFNFIRLIFDRRVKGFPNERIAFTSSAVLELIQTMIRKDSSYNIQPVPNAYGMNVWQIDFLGNSLKFMTHPLFVENPTWAKLLYVLHPGLIEKKILRPTVTQEYLIERNTNAGVDADEGFILDEMGFHLGGARLCGEMKNIVTAVAS